MEEWGQGDRETGRQGKNCKFLNTNCSKAGTQYREHSIVLITFYEHRSIIVHLITNHSAQTSAHSNRKSQIPSLSRCCSVEEKNWIRMAMNGQSDWQRGVAVEEALDQRGFVGAGDDDD